MLLTVAAREYAKERRLYLPIQAIPKSVINAFIAAEDKSFYEHNGIDFPASPAQPSPMCRTMAVAAARRVHRPLRSKSPRTSC